MSAHPTKLKSHLTGEHVNASIHDDLGVDSLLDAEEAWASQRIQITRLLVSNKIAVNRWPQGLHWSWARKAISLVHDLGTGFSTHRLFGIDVDEKWQGPLLGECTDHRSRITTPSNELVYISFVETAPWNWPLEPVGQQPRFKGVGLQLIAMAILWSRRLGFHGRIGLHSLPPAEEFYRDRCRMTDLGEDPQYDDLRYFEMTKEQSEAYFSRSQS